MVRAFICALFLATQAGAAQQQSCQAFILSDTDPNLTHGPSRSYANGRILLTQVDIEEPTCCGVFLEVQFPVPGQDALSCTLVGEQVGSGWGAIDLKRATSSYDPASGLMIQVPVRAFDGEVFRDAQVNIKINQDLGSVLVQ